MSDVLCIITTGVEGFSVGDSVYGDVLGLRTGTVAQYVVVDSRIMKHKPSNLSHVQAAGAPLAGMTALQCFSTTGMHHHLSPEVMWCV